MRHPVNQYLLIRRFNSDWKAIADLLTSNETPPEFDEYILTNSEIIGASEALSRISDVYDVHPLEMALGNVSNGKLKYLKFEKIQ